jgi:hypothetical protein
MLRLFLESMQAVFPSGNFPPQTASFSSGLILVQFSVPCSKKEEAEATFGFDRNDNAQEIYASNFANQEVNR